MDAVKLVNYAVQGVICFWFFYRILNSERSYLRGTIVMVLVSILLNYVDHALLFVPALSAQWVKPIVNSVFMIIALMMILKVSFKKAFLNAYLPFMILISISELLTFSVASKVLGMDVIDLYEKSLGATVLIYFMCDVMDLAALAVYIRFRGSGDISLIPNGMLSVILIGVVFQTIVLSALSYMIVYSGEIDQMAAALMTVLFILGETGVYYIQRKIRRVQKLLRQSKELDEEENIIDEQMEYLKEKDAKADDLQKEMEEAVSHIGEPLDQSIIAEHYSSYREHQYTDDVVLNVLLQSYARRFKIMNIDYEFKIVCSMENTLDPLDMVKVFSNLLDNAMEAVQENPDIEKHISLSVKKAVNLYQIEVENDIPHKHVTLNKKVQGEGMKIVQDVMDHHDGSMHVSEDSSMYHAVLNYQIGGESV